MPGYGGTYLRLDEEDKSPAQLQQRDKTYEAAKKLRDLGYDVKVLEWWTGKNSECYPAGIVLKLEQIK